MERLYAADLSGEEVVNVKLDDEGGTVEACWDVNLVQSNCVTSFIADCDVEHGRARNHMVEVNTNLPRFGEIAEVEVDLRVVIDKKASIKILT